MFNVLSFLRPSGAHLSERERWLVQVYRLLALLGVILVPAFGVLYRLWPPEVVDPWWCRGVVAGLYGLLFGGSYAVEWIREHFPVLMWGCFYVMVSWVVGLMAVNQVVGSYAVGLLLVYCIVGISIGIGVESMGPLLWFLGYGFGLVAGVYVVVPSPTTNPLVLLGSLGAMAIILSVIFDARLSMQRKLQAAREEAEAASQLKSALLANMSHEVRTPLTSILGFAELIADADPDNPGALADHIRQSGRRLLDTLDSVLKVSRLESGTVELQPKSVDVGGVVAERVDAFETEAERSDVRLEFCRSSGTVTAQLDPDALGRIVDELVRNAIDFSESGDRAWVVVQKQSEDVTITVEDTGVGIDEERLDELFRPFEQASVGWDRTHEGTGLGLTVVRRLLRLMDGSIDVESEKGEGTRVVVTLPRCAPAPESKESTSDRAPVQWTSDFEAAAAR